MADKSYAPKLYSSVMVSSTFTDLKALREKLKEFIEKHGFKAEVMESDGARADVEVIDSSLQMVRNCAAYVGVISRKYGQTPACPDRNPNKRSLTELEFDEAMRLKRPILLFIMDESYPAGEVHIELNAAKRKRLEAFRKRARKMSADSEVERIWESFKSPEQFAEATAIAVGRLARFLDQRPPKARPRKKPAKPKPKPKSDDKSLPLPPALRALPKYLGSHKFLGRKAELEALDDWCAEADPNPMLLFEAMGGSGKSILTWEWVNNHAPGKREWAGRFWYSFYERGAVMADFCRQALAYVTGKPAEDFAKQRTPELADLLVAELERKPWLLALDGLERVLVAYHRFDAAQMPDDAADDAEDKIAKRDPCAAIRPEDEDLLRRLAAAAPSKILVTSRLTPAALVNKSGQAVPGVKREFLKGLRPADAEALFRACGVTGDSQAIQNYLQTNCDCHPLVVGVLAGLVNDYPHERGNFDRWAADAGFGGRLDLGALDLTQKKNHILLAAIEALAPQSRRLLQTLALLQGGADFETLQNFNPHLPSEPEEV